MTRRLAAIALTAYTLALSVFVLVNEPGGESGVEWLYIVPVVTAAVMSLFISVRRPENGVGTLIGVSGAALVTLGATNFLVPEMAGRGQDLATVLLLLLADGAWIIQYVSAFVLLPLWFPTGSAPGRRWAWVGRSAAIFAAAAFVSFAFAEEVCVRFDASGACVEPLPVPWGVEGFSGLEPLLLVAMVMAVPAIVAVFVRLRRSVGVERQQLKWFLFAATGLIVGLISSFDNFGLDQVVNDAISAVTLSALWVAIAVAIVRHRLFDIDRIITRTVSYAIVVGILGLALFGLITLFAAVLPSDDPLVVAISTLAVAAMFDPVRRRVQRAVDRRFNRSRFDAQLVVEEFTGSLRDRVDSERVLDEWIGVVAQTMQPARVGVWLRDR